MQVTCKRFLGVQRILYMSLPLKCYLTENTGKTSTGTIYVEVPGFNENCPTIVLEKKTICSSQPSVVVSARALDNKYSGPYTFSLEEQPLKLPVVWSITTLNGE